MMLDTQQKDRQRCTTEWAVTRRVGPIDAFLDATRQSDGAIHH